MGSDFTFTDNRGDEWDLQINYAVAKRVSEYDFSPLTKAPVSLLAPSADCHGLWLSSMPLIVGVCFAICEEQAKERGVTQEQWEERLGGDALRNMQEAFWRACADFFPDQRTVYLAYFEHWNETKAELEKITEQVADKAKQNLEKVKKSARAAMASSRRPPKRKRAKRKTGRTGTRS